MQAKHTIIGFFLFLLFCCPLFAQSSNNEIKIFDESGIKFNYPSDWIITDKNQPDKKYLILSKQDLSVLIAVVSPYNFTNSKGFQGMQSRINSLFVGSLENLFDPSLHSTKKEYVCMDFNGTNVPGIKYSGLNKNEPTIGETYTFTVGTKSLSLIYIRAEKDSSTGDKVWKDLLKSVYLEGSNQAKEGDLLNSGNEDILNSKATKLATPIRPTEAKKMGILEGKVKVAIIINEEGKVISAKAISGPPIFYPHAVSAAQDSKFAPTMVCGKLIKTTGILVYDFPMK